VKSKTKNIFQLRIFQSICRLVLGGVFILASIDKLIYPVEFAQVVANYRIVPPVFIGSVALILPWIELVCGIFLIVGVFKKASAVILSILLAIFISAIFSTLVRGISLDCGCFKASAEAGKEAISPYLLILRDIMLLIPAIIIGLEKNRGKE